MKNNSIYMERLEKFAAHISKIENHPEDGLIETVTLVALEENIQIPYEVRYHFWVFDELPECFDEWHYSKKFGEALWEESDPEEGTVASVIDFFSLGLDEFSHLFDLDGFQNVDQFGGRKLTEESKGEDIARNIFELIKRKSNS